MRTQPTTPTDEGVWAWLKYEDFDEPEYGECHECHDPDASIDAGYHWDFVAPDVGDACEHCGIRIVEYEEGDEG